MFEALVNPKDLRAWWSTEAFVEAELGGRYETNPAAGTQEGTITGLRAPRHLVFTWEIPHEGAPVETHVTYELAPKGEDTLVHVVHRSPKLLEHDWNAVWHRALEALKAFLETGGGAPPPESPGGQTAT